MPHQATAIPQITSDFQSLDDIGWYGSSYLIAQMALLPTCGCLRILQHKVGVLSLAGYL
jgi:hypothetical protein